MYRIFPGPIGVFERAGDIKAIRRCHRDRITSNMINWINEGNITAVDTLRTLNAILEPAPVPDVVPAPVAPPPDTETLDRKIEMYKRKAKSLVLRDATEAKVETMPLEKVRLLANKAKALVESFEYLYTVVDRTDKIEKLEFTVAEHPTLEDSRVPGKCGNEVVQARRRFENR